MSKFGPLEAYESLNNKTSHYPELIISESGEGLSENDLILCFGNDHAPMELIFPDGHKVIVVWSHERTDQEIMSEVEKLIPYLKEKKAAINRVGEDGINMLKYYAAEDNTQVIKDPDIDVIHRAVSGEVAAIDGVHPDAYDAEWGPLK